MNRKGLGKGKGSGWKNIKNNDSGRHNLSRMGIKSAEQISPSMKNMLKQPMSERTKINLKYEKFIIDSINSDGYDENPVTDKEKLQFLKDRFISEHWKNNEQTQSLGQIKSFAEWISGLPSSFNIPFSNFEILQLAKKMGSLPENATEKQEDRVLDNYWNFMAIKTFQAFKKYGIN